jgi:hypothetical protein
MGGNVSVLNQKASNRVITASVMEQFSKITQSVALTNNQSQTILLTGIVANNCKIKISQNQNLTLNATVNLSTQQIAQAATSIATDVLGSLKSELDQKNKDLVLFTANAAVTEQQFTTELTTVIRNSLVAVQQAYFSQSTQGSQYLELKQPIQCSGAFAGVDLTQNTFLQIYANIVANNVYNNIMANSSTQQVVSAFDNKMDQTNAGINLFGIISIVAVVVVVIIVLLVVMGMSGGDDDEGGGMVDVAAMVGPPPLKAAALAKKAID